MDFLDFCMLTVLIVLGLFLIYVGLNEKEFVGIALGLFIAIVPTYFYYDFATSDVEKVVADEKEKSVTSDATLLKNAYIVEGALKDEKLDKKEVKELLRAGEALDISIDKEIEAYIKERTVLTESKLELKIDEIVTALDK